MLQLTEDIILYHGSYCEVSRPMLERCAKNKDFGQGFYLTSSKNQASGFTGTAIAKAVSAGIPDVNRNTGVISIYRFEPLNDLRIFQFNEADAEWLHCIAAHRRSGLNPALVAEMRKYDIIYGKIANDQTNATLTAYLAGAFGPVGSERADAICISLLLPERLEDQLCFRSNAAIERLVFQGSETVCLK